MVEANTYNQKMIYFTHSPRLFLLSAVVLFLVTFTSGQQVADCRELLFNVPIALNATAWSTCSNQTDSFGTGQWNFGEFQCRTVWYPATYLVNGTKGVQRNFERRIVKGTPKSIVYLIAGGPGISSDALALASAKQIDKALLTNYAIYIPALRGTTNTAAFTPYLEFPNNLFEKLHVGQSRNYTDYSVTNTAMDVILSIRSTKDEFKTATLNAIGFSFGGYIVQRIMAIQPALLASAILDSTPAPVNGTNPFAGATLGASPLQTLLMNNCERNPLCKARSLTSTELNNFLILADSASNPCLDLLPVVFNLPGALPKGQLVSQLLHMLLTINIGIPKSLLQLNSADPSFNREVLKAVLATSARESQGADSLYVDTRAIALSFINQVAQCSQGNDARLESFKQVLAVFKKLFPILFVLAATSSSTSSIFGVNPITNWLVTLSEGRYPLVSVHNGKTQAQSSFLHPPLQYYDLETINLAEIAKFPSFQDCFSNKFPMNVQTRVAFLGGRLDNAVPIGETQRAFNLLQVNSRAGGKKNIFIHNNGGHMVIGYGYSACTQYLIRAVILKSSPTMTQYQKCLSLENSVPIDWPMAAIPTALNTTTGIWDGLTARFSHAPTRSPTRKPTESPTVKPTLSPTAKITQSPTTVAPSLSPTTFKQFCNAIKNKNPCISAGCVWRTVRKVCTPD